MGRHVLFVEGQADSPVPAHAPPGWRLSRLREAGAALDWLRDHHADLLVVGQRPADRPAEQLVRAVKLDHATSLLPTVQLGDGSMTGLRAEPDAWLAPAAPHTLPAALAQAQAAWAERARDAARADLPLVLPSDLDHLEEMNDLMAGWFAACGFGKLMCQQLTLAVRELVANAIEWGHRHDRSRAVCVHARLDPEKVCVLVSDSGPGFDPRDLPHAARPGDPLSHLAVRSQLQIREGGFGILMTRGLVDQLAYNDRGNEVQLIKYLPARLQRHAAAQPARRCQP